MKGRAKRTYISPDMDDLIENTRRQLSLKAQEVGIPKQFSRIEASKILALKFKEYDQKRKRERRNDYGIRMFDF